MKLRTLGLAATGTVVAAGLALGGVASANAASIADTTSNTADTTYTVIAKGLTAGADATVILSGATDESTTETTVNANGKVRYTFAPSDAGIYKVTFSADDETVTKRIVVGDAYEKATVAAPSTTTKKTEISGTAAADSTLVLTVTDPDGETVATKTVDVDSDGEWSTTVKKATDDGTYTVSVEYEATDDSYGAKAYTDTFVRS